MNIEEMDESEFKIDKEIKTIKIKIKKIKYDKTTTTTPPTTTTTQPTTQPTTPPP